MYSNFDEQRHYIDWVYLQDPQGRPREMLIREAAAEMRRDPQSYTSGGSYILVRTGKPRIGYVSENDRLPPPGSAGMHYIQVGPVRLLPELQAPNMADIAQIIVERIIRPEWP